MLFRSQAMEDYSEISKNLRKEAIEALLNYEIWWTYRDPDIAPMYTDILNRHSTFFTTSKNAHFVAMVLPLYRIFETRKDSINLPRLLRKLRDDGILPVIQLDELDKQYQKLKPAWLKIATLRNEVFGHRSGDLTVEESFKKAQISSNDISKFIDEILILLNKVDSQLNPDSYQSFQVNSGDELKQILTILKNAQTGK